LRWQSATGHCISQRLALRGNEIQPPPARRPNSIWSNAVFEKKDIV